jgi:gamma-glutamylcyclotransferase (GGCT)/AIG2-like uncharacterized protein YtfP
MGERRRSTGSFDVQRTTGSNAVLDRLFVYATLREGQTARSLIANQITRSVNASTTGAIYAFPIGYAGFVEVNEAMNEASATGVRSRTASPGEQERAPAGSMRVIGELVWLAELPATLGLLDAYEGQDFARVIKQVQLETGDTMWSWIYVLADPEMIRHGTLIDHGDWVRYLAQPGT